MSSPLVSVVVTTRNEAANISTCLESVRLQTYAPIESIVVDNASTDDTKALALAYTDKVMDKGPERSAQRNHGMIEMARGRYVMFVDADMILAPRLVEACVAHMETNNCLALHISELVLGSRYWSRVRRFERSFYDGTVIDGARFFRKDAFVTAGGFDLSMSGPEDWDIDKTLKTMGHIDLLSVRGLQPLPNWPLASFVRERGVVTDGSAAIIYHNESELEIVPYLRKKGYYAKSMDAYLNKWGSDDLDVKKQLGLGYRYFGVFLENGKWARLLAHPALALGMYFLRFLVGVRYLTRR